MNHVGNRLVLWTALLCAVPSTPALADSPVFTAAVSGYTAIENRPIVATDRVAVDTTQQSNFNRAEASGEGGQLISYPSFGPNDTGYTSSYARGYASSEPGLLRVYGGVLSVATDFQNKTTGNYSPSGYNVASSINVGASFADTVTIGGVGMAMGALVQLPVNFLAEMVSNYSLGYPVYSQHALSAYASFLLPGLGPQIFSTESGYFPWTVTRASDTTSLYRVRSDVDYLVNVHVGDVFAVGATFGVTGLANITDPNRQINVGGFVDGSNTAALWFGKLPDGVFLTSASGHDYTIDPTALIVTTPVPEPETYALMLVGLMATGIALRRRTIRPHRASSQT